MGIEWIPAAEYDRRRKKLLSSLGGSVGLLFAGEHDPNGDTAFRPHPHFEYLTGVADEPGAVLLLDSSQPVAARRSMLFLRPIDPERDRWDGYRMTIAAPLREKTGFELIYRTDSLPRLLTVAARRARRLACLHPPAAFTRPVSRDLAVFRKVAERMPGVAIEDRSDLVERMRSVKSKNEHALIQRAIDITAVGFQAMLEAARPGLNEFDLQETIEHAYRTHGARGTAFSTIVGSGVNSTVLHYRANDRPLADGDLICVDSGAVFGGYSADVTRTVPVSGRFSKRQKEVYETVLKAQQAAIRAVKPGATLQQIDAPARKVITDAGFGDAFIHSIGHHLGLETHDAAPDEPVKAGAVVTVEPGIYLPDEAIGVRIEDDVLVTPQGPRVMSTKIPKTVAAIEKAMGGRG